MPICFNMGKMDAEYDMTHLFQLYSSNKTICSISEFCLDLQDTDVFCSICMRKKESDTYDKNSTGCSYKGFIENAYQIFRQHK